MKDSIKELVDLFPHFFDKSPESNFYKSQRVTNNQLKKVYQDIQNVKDSLSLRKNVLIFKEQTQPYDYSIHFLVTYPNLKTVTCYKNNELIYSEAYLEEDNVNSFVYIYDSVEETETASIESEENEDETPNPPIIPLDTFEIKVETYDEIIIEKGFPENDTIRGDIYDHDTSLDEIGALNNIPRKQYLQLLDESLYPYTEPPYNNQITEDDYHYMNRIINYNLQLHNTPLPVLEIWKMYGLPAELINRERLLFKWFDVDKHPSSEGKVLDWTPQKWEHKDGFHDLGNQLGTYFFATPSTNIPKKWNGVTISFRLLNNLAETLDIPFTVDIYKNNIIETSGWADDTYYISSEKLDEEHENYWTFIAYDAEGNVIGEENLILTVKGCNNADWYVSNTGDDNTGDGSRNNPFKTLSKALTHVNDVENMIVISGNVTIDETLLINNNITILGCGNATISNDVSNRFAHLIGNKKLTLTLIDITLEANGVTSYFKSTNISNNNLEFNNYVTVLVHGGIPLLEIETDKEEYYNEYDNILVSGTFFSKEGNPIKNNHIKLTIGESTVTTVTDNNGEFTATLPVHETLSDKVIAEFIGTTTYYETSIESEIGLKNPVYISLATGGSTTIIATGYSSGDSVRFYDNNTLIDAVTADNAGNASLTFTPDYGRLIIYSSLDGVSIENEWIIDTTLKISNLDLEYLITDIYLDGTKLMMEKTPITDFNTISDLQNAIMDISVEDGVISVERFQSHYQTSEILTNDEVYPLDAIDLNTALIGLSVENGVLTAIYNSEE